MLARLRSTLETVGTLVLAGALVLGIGLAAAPPASAGQPARIDGGPTHGSLAGASSADSSVEPSETGSATDVEAALQEPPSIVGRVTSDGVRGIANVGVTLYWLDVLGDWYYDERVYSDADGRFAFTDVDPSHIHIVGFFETGDYASTYYGGETKKTATRISSVTTRIELATVTLAPTVALTGIVTGHLSDGVDRIGVDAYAWNSDRGTWSHAGATYTSADGRYVLGGLNPHTDHRLRFSDDRYLTIYYGGASDLRSARTIRTGAGTTEVGETALARAARITGKVTFVDARDVANTVVLAHQFRDGEWNSAGWAQTDAGGVFFIGGLEPGTYRLEYRGSSSKAGTFSGGALTVEGGTDLVAEAGTTTAPTIDLPPAAWISGTVATDDATRLSGVAVYAYAWESSTQRWIATSSARTLDDGRYSIDGLREGTAYRLEFVEHSGLYVPQFYRGKATLDEADEIVAMGYRTVASTVTLRAATRITGVVTLDGTVGIEGIRATLYGKTGEGWTTQRTTVTDDAGRYAFGDISPGTTYRIQFASAGAYAVTYFGGASFADAEDIVLGGNPRDLPAVTLDGGATVTGTIADTDDVGIEGRWVTALEWDAATDRATEVAGAHSDPYGNFAIPGLAPGQTYRIKVDGSSVYVGKFYGDATEIQDATAVEAPRDIGTIRLARDERAGIGITLATGSDIVTEGDSVTLTATLSSAATGWVTFVTTTDELGRAAIVNGVATLTTSALPTGTARVRGRYEGDARHRAALSRELAIRVDVKVPPTPTPVPAPSPTPPPTPAPKPVSTPVVQTKVTLSRPTWSKSKQTHGHRSVARVTTSVTGATSGKVTFRQGSRVLGTAVIVAGKATYVLPARQAVGSYVVTASLAPTRTTGAATSPRSTRFTVVKAKLAKRPVVRAKSFTKDKKPKVTIALGRLNTGAYATGRVKVYVGSKLATTVSVPKKSKGKVVITLPKKYSRSIKVKATFIGSSTVAAATSKATTVKIKAPTGSHR